MFFRHNIAGLLWAIFIFILCVIPGSAIPHNKWTDLLSIDKAVHAFLFAVLMLLFLRGFKRQTRYPLLQSHTVIILILLCAFYGGFIELFQNYMLTDRNGSWFDWIADIFGCISGIIINNYLRKKQLSFFGFGV
jgi:membrane associated rhomboid family serine protease